MSRRARRWLRRLSLAVARRAPAPAWRRVLHLWLDVKTSRPPRTALLDLFHLEARLDRALDDAAIRYEGGIHPKHRLMRYHDFFVQRLQPGERVLDLGCGTGSVAYSMARRAGAEVTAIDIVDSHIRRARALYSHPRLRFVHGDALEELPDEAFDTIVISNVLEHFDHRVAFLRTAQEKLSPRRWLIRLPMATRSWRVPLRGELGLVTYNDPDHRIEYTLPALSGELAAAGLRLTHVETGWGEVWAEAEAVSEAGAEAVSETGGRGAGGGVSRDPRVSVVMPVYNGVDHLAETLDSLRAQSLEDWELVVVDDGSTDGSWELLASYAAFDPRIRIDRHPHNQGHRAASNRAFALARGTYVARNDQDDLSLSRRLELQTDFLDRHPKVGLVASAYRNQFTNGRTTTVTPPHEHAAIQWVLLFDMVFCHSSLMFRRDLVRGPSPYRYAPAAYDYEVCARLGRVTRLAALAEPLVHYRIHGGGLSTTGQDAMLCSAAAISARQLRRLLAPRRLSRAEITSLRSLASAKRVTAADLHRIPLFLELMERFGHEPGVTPGDLDSIRRSWTARMVRHVPLRELGPLLRRDPAVVGGLVLRRAMHRAGRLGGRLLGAR